MNDKLKIEIKIADVESISLKIDRAEERVYRKAAELINNTWADLRMAHKNKSSHYVLALTALAAAELYYRKSGQIEAQGRMIDDFEKQLDELLLKVE
ncbi:MAG: cell division protein ZapA [Muribaculaceae bacterium]|nr:cell division protein ZapA [Muribaculaceae bacterium]MDE6368991.1 cell division protein ZapA [Muribaculaceae bacterium]